MCGFLCKILEIRYVLSLTKYIDTFQGNVKSLQSASMIIGKFIKAKAVKKTDEEVLEGFGAEKQSSDDDSLGQSMRQDGKNKIHMYFINIFSRKKFCSA